MIRGVSFRIKDAGKGTVLKQILQNIDVKKYFWHNIISQNEIWSDLEGNINFDEEYYAGNDFLKLIQLQHYIIFLKIQGYLKSNNCYDICTYEQFLKSECKIIILIADCEFVEIYTKELEDANCIYQTAQKNNFEDICYITENNDYRKEMKLL